MLVTLTTLLLSLAPQAPLRVLQPNDLPGYGLVAEISRDGTELLQARGPVLTRFDFEAIRAQVLEPVDGFDVGAALISNVALDAPIQAFCALPGGDVLVAGGDVGLLRVTSAGEVDLVDQRGGRWCMDVDAVGTRLVALWGAWDDSELVSYDLDGLRVLGSAGLRSSAAGGNLAAAGQGFVCRVAGAGVFVAMGTGGVVRVDMDGAGKLGAVRQGAIWGPRGAGVSRAQRFEYAVRDLDVAGKKLFVAANRAGLLEYEWGVGGDFRKRPAFRRAPINHSQSEPFVEHVIRVEATLQRQGEAGPQRVLVAAGITAKPHVAFEWGPFRSAGNYTWLLNAPNSQKVSRQATRASALAIYSTPIKGGRAALLDRMEFPEGRHVWASLAMFVETAGRAWISDQSMHVFPFVNGHLVNTSPRAFADDRPQFSLYTSGVYSKLTPEVFFSGVDGAESMPWLKLQQDGKSRVLKPSGAAPPVSPPVLLQDTWLATHEGRAEEWFLGFQDQPWRLFRWLESGNQNRSWDLNGLGPGRSYGAVAIDPRLGADTLALSQTGADFGIGLVSRRTLMDQARRAETGVRALPGLPEGELKRLNTNPEAQPGGVRQAAFGSSYFDWNGPRGSELILGLAAGSMRAPKSSANEHSKVVLFRMQDCANPIDDCSASQAPNASNVTLLIGSKPQAMAFNFVVSETPKGQFAFVVDTAGGIGVYDLSRAFSGDSKRGFSVVAECARWDMPPTKWDGLSVPLVDVVARMEQPSPGQAAQLHLYVAASRAGILRLRVDLGAPDEASRLTLVERLATPMQASGLSLSKDPLTGEDLLTVCDHDGTSPRIYRAE